MHLRNFSSQVLRERLSTRYVEKLDGQNSFVGSSGENVIKSFCLGTTDVKFVYMYLFSHNHRLVI